jgi:hypothetical protein
MSDEGDPKPEPLPPRPTEAPPPPTGAPPPPTGVISQKVTRLAVAIDERKKRMGRLLLHVRYVFGYLAAGFLVSVPISLGSRIGAGLEALEAVKEIALSLVYGAVLYVPFFALLPFSNVDWKAMRVPEFQLFELAVTRTATVVAAVMLVLTVQARVFSKLAEPRVVWTVFVLMIFSWARIKVQTFLFPEFYAAAAPASGGASGD